MEKARLIFTERPYDVVIDDEYVQKYFASYSNEKCSAEDWPWHQFDRAAFLMFKHDQRMSKVEARIVTRLLAEFRHDEGIIWLSEGSPTFAKDRQYGDLLSHYNEIKKDTWSMKRKEALSMFGISSSKVNVYVIIFYITDANENVGLGLYLNTYRFNPCCSPTANASFKCDDSTEILAIEDVHPNKFTTEDRCNHLMIDYGTSGMHSSRSNDASFDRQHLDAIKLPSPPNRLFLITAFSTMIKSATARPISTDPSQMFNPAWMAITGAAILLMIIITVVLCGGKKKKRNKEATGKGEATGKEGKEKKDKIKATEPEKKAKGGSQMISTVGPKDDKKDGKRDKKELKEAKKEKKAAASHLVAKIPDDEQKSTTFNLPPLTQTSPSKLIKNQLEEGKKKKK